MASEANLEQARASLRALSINAENDDDDAPVLDEGADEDAVEDRELMDFDDEEDGGFVSEIMMSLDTEKVKALRTEFSRRVDGLELPEFCHVMKSCLLNMPGEGADADPHGAAPEGDNSKLKSMGDARLVAHPLRDLRRFAGDIGQLLRRGALVGVRGGGEAGAVAAILQFIARCSQPCSSSDENAPCRC